MELKEPSARVKINHINIHPGEVLPALLWINKAKAVHVVLRVLPNGTP